MDYATKYLGQTVKVKMDRPLGTKHPKHGFVYCLNYGYIPDNIAPDGEELDAYVLGVFDPIDKFEGDCIAICQSLEILYYYLANYLGKFLIKSNVYFLGECKSILV